MRALILIGLLVITAVACAEMDQVEGAVARVNDKYLYEEELREIIPAGLSREDSLLFRNNYIKNWATRELLLDKAKINVSGEDEEIRKLVENYEMELLIDRYKQALLSQELDTILTEEDLNEYYQMNKNVYKLNEEILQLRFMHFSEDLSDKKEVVEMFRSGSEEDSEELMQRELEFYSLSLNDSIWVRKTVVEQRIPFLKEEGELKKGQFVQKEDSLGVYLVAVKNALGRNDVAPKSYVIPTIRKMILHNRKLELMNDIEKTIVIDAINNKQFEQYE